MVMAGRAVRAAGLGAGAAPWGHGKPAPALRCPVQDRPDQAEAALLTRQVVDHLDPAAGLAEGPLDEVGVPDALAVLSREQQVGTEGVEVVLEADDRRG